MKKSVIQYIRTKENSPDKNLKKFSKIVLKNIDNFNCYKCLDTGIYWKDRDTFAARNDLINGRYDIMNCSECSNGHWNRLSHNNSIRNDSGIKIFNKGVKLNDIIEELKNIYKDKINEPDEEWNLYAKDIVIKKTKEIEINANLKELGNLIVASFEAYTGNILGLASTLKNFTVNIGSTLTNENDSKEIIKTYNSEDKKYYLFFQIEKTIKKRSMLGNFFKSRKFTFKSKYLILSPGNSISDRICQDLMNKNIDNKIENFTL